MDLSNTTVSTVQKMNEDRCNRISIEEWASWFEGEESWGFEDDD